MLRVRFHVQAVCTLTPLPGCLVATRLGVQHHCCSQCVSRVACRLRVRVLVKLSQPRPPDRNQHGCTVGVLPGPTRVLPMPKQYGIGRRAPTRAVLSCAASWCLVVRRPRRRVDCLLLTFCYVSSRRLTEIIVRKEVSVVPHQPRSVLINFPPPLLLIPPRDDGLLDRKTECLLSPH